MSRPNDIPEDVWEAAAKFWAGDGSERAAVARAILAERERCADIADFGVKWTPVPTGDVQKIVDESCARIAAAIRKGT
jgi:hypothetical protein